MDTVERQVRLPTGAVALERYARAYAFGPNDRVAAYYFLPDERRDVSDCRGAQAGGALNAGQIALICPPPIGMEPGERRWCATERHLPVVYDGGCSYIEVEFDMRRDSIVRVECNGSAGSMT